MENINQNELSLNQEAKVHLSTSLKWSKILGVIGIVILGLWILGSLFSIIGMLSGESNYNYYGFNYMAIINVLVTLIFSGLYLIPTIGLLKFANTGKRSLASSDPITLAQSFNAFQKALKFAGVLVFVQIGVQILLNVINALVFADSFGY